MEDKRLFLCTAELIDRPIDRRIEGIYLSPGYNVLWGILINKYGVITLD